MRCNRLFSCAGACSKMFYCRCAYELGTAVSINLLSGNAAEASERAFDEGDHSALQPNTSGDTASSPKHDTKA